MEKKNKTQNKQNYTKAQKLAKYFIFTSINYNITKDKSECCSLIILT